MVQTTERVPRTELTREHKQMVVRAFPNEYGIQREVADVAKKQRLTVTQTRTFVDAVLGIETEEGMREIGASDAWIEQVNVLKKSLQAPSLVRNTPEALPNGVYGGRLVGLRPHVEALQGRGYAETTAIAENIVLSSLNLLDGWPVDRIRKDKSVFFEGNSAAELVILRRGAAIISNENRVSGERAGYLVDGFAAIGGDILSGSEAFLSSARTFTAADIQRIPAGQLQALIRKHPSFGSFLFIEQSIRDREHERHMLEWKFKPVQERVAGAILDFASRVDSIPDHVRFTQALAGVLSGCTRESVNKEVRRFIRRGDIFWDELLGPQLIDTASFKLLRGREYGSLIQQA